MNSREKLRLAKMINKGDNIYYCRDVNGPAYKVLKMIKFYFVELSGGGAILLDEREIEDFFKADRLK